MFTGQMNVDYWKKPDWDKQFRENQVLVCTTQVLLNCILHKFISLTDFNLLVFDECHHATGNHAMHQFMQQFQNERDQSGLPRVIGLTGVLIKSSKESQIIDDLNKLEAVFRGKIITVENMNEYKNVMIYSTSPNEIVKSWAFTASTPNALCEQIKTVITGMVTVLDSLKDNVFHRKMSKNMGAFRPPSPIKKIKNLLLDFVYHLEELGAYAGSISIDFVLTELEFQSKSGDTDYFREYATKTIGICKWAKGQLMTLIYGSETKVMRSVEEERKAILNNCTKKLSSLLEYLTNEFRYKSFRDIKCLIFVLRRYTTKVLHFVVTNYSGNEMQYIPLKTQFMVGKNQALPERMDNLTDEKHEKDVMKKFRQSYVNCIICSSVLEEGIDVQECNYVIMFDELKNFNTYVQTKGRARMRDSFYVIFHSNKPEDHAKLTKKLETFQNMDKLLKNYFIERTIDRQKPSEHHHAGGGFHSVVEPYLSKIGARLEAESVLSLLHRYCNCLPNDNYANAEDIIWKKLEVERGCQVSLQLPMQSTVKDVLIVSICI